jgi:hypothetical protein
VAAPLRLEAEQKSAAFTAELDAALALRNRYTLGEEILDVSVTQRSALPQCRSAVLVSSGAYPILSLTGLFAASPTEDQPNAVAGSISR